jgi:hypothetical protein
MVSGLMPMQFAKISILSLAEWNDPLKRIRRNAEL